MWMVSEMILIIVRKKINDLNIDEKETIMMMEVTIMNQMEK